MGVDGLAKSLRQQNRNSVSDLFGHRGETSLKQEFAREGLKAGSLSQAQSSILGGMAEAAVRKTDATSRQSPCWAIPSQAAVDISMPLMAPVAPKNEIIRPTAAIAPLWSACNALEIQR